MPTAIKNDAREKDVIEWIEQKFDSGPKNPIIKACVDCWNNKEHVSQEQAQQAFDALINGEASEIQIGELLYHAHPEFLTSEEIAGFALSLRSKSKHVAVSGGEQLGDTCGTGGDTIPTFNVSTTIMFVLAAAGMKIAKHGNNAFTSRCGSADVLNHLGVQIDLSPDKVTECIEKVGIGFMYAPVFHTATSRVQKVRTILATELPANLRRRSVFNVLGPLSNPANTPFQMLGVYNKNVADKLIQVLKKLSIKRAFVAHGTSDDPNDGGKGLDEVSTLGTTYIAELKDGKIDGREIRPEDMGLKVSSAAEINGGDIETNAKLLQGILEGKITGPKRDLVLANAAVALSLLDNGTTFDGLKQNVKKAAEMIDTGAASETLQKLISTTRKLAGVTS